MRQLMVDVLCLPGRPSLRVFTSTVNLELEVACFRKQCLLLSLLNSLGRMGTFVEELFRDVAAERRAFGSWLLGR